MPRLRTFTISFMLSGTAMLYLAALFFLGWQRVVAVLMAGAFSFWLLYLWSFERALVQRYSVALGRVLELHAHDPREMFDSWFRYEFVAEDGRTVQGRSQATRKSMPAEGSPVLIAYASDEPEKFSQPFVTFWLYEFGCE